MKLLKILPVPLMGHAYMSTALKENMTGGGEGFWVGGTGVQLISRMATPKIKQVEKDGLPPVDQPVWVDCGGYRCFGRIEPSGKWVDHHGNELKNVVGYYFFD